MSELTILAPVTEIWGMEPVPISTGIAAMFVRGKIHSFATTGLRDGDHKVTVPFFRWTMLRAVGDRAKVPCAVYCPAGGDDERALVFCSWPAQGGLSYGIIRDPVAGCVISIPSSEFKPVAKKGVAE